MNLHFLLSLLVLLVLESALFAKKGDVPEVEELVQTPGRHAKMEEVQGPWFTGPLLAPSGHAVPLGFVNFEPYTFANTVTGRYDDNWNSSALPHFHNVVFQAPLFIGLTPWMDTIITPQVNYNSTQGVSSVGVGDFNIKLDFQLLRDTPENKLPGIKFSIAESFPLGKFDRLDPGLLGTDAAGSGSYETTFGIVFTRLFNVYGSHFLSSRLFLFYQVPSNVHVKGFNLYGGVEDTDGTIKPPQLAGGIIGLEYNLTQNWALALDLTGTYATRIRFSGRAGLTDAGERVDLSSPSFWQFTLAPAIEYNFSSAVGLIAGAWFTVAGQNTARFVNGVIALNFYGPITEDAKHTRFHSHGAGASL